MNNESAENLTCDAVSRCIDPNTNMKISKTKCLCKYQNPICTLSHAIEKIIGIGKKLDYLKVYNILYSNRSAVNSCFRLKKIAMQIQSFQHFNRRLS